MRDEVLMRVPGMQAGPCRHRSAPMDHSVGASCAPFQGPWALHSTQPQNHTATGLYFALVINVYQIF